MRSVLICLKMTTRMINRLSQPIFFKNILLSDFLTNSADKKTNKENVETICHLGHASRESIKTKSVTKIIKRARLNILNMLSTYFSLHLDTQCLN